MTSSGVGWYRLMFHQRGLAIHEHTVEGVFVSDDEFLQKGRTIRLGGRPAQPVPGLVGVVDPKGVAGARPGRRLGHHRKSDLLDERHCLFRTSHQAMLGAGQSGLVEDPLHPVFVAEVAGGLDVDAGNAECLPHLRHRNLQLLQRSHQAIDRLRSGRRSPAPP